MNKKLVFRSVKKSIKDYAIYVVTLIICVALFYAFLSISSKYYNPQLGEEYNITILSDGMKMIICVITCMIAFLVKYVNDYMLRRKKREYAILTVIGMERRTIAGNFFVETLIMSGFSVLVGIVCGSAVSQVISAMLLKVYHKNYEFMWMLYPDTIVCTILFFTICFLVVGSRNYYTLSKISILEMLRGERENETYEAKEKGMQLITLCYYILVIILIKKSVTCLIDFYDERYVFFAKTVLIGNFAAPCLSVLLGIVWIVRKKKNMVSLYRMLLGSMTLTMLFNALLPLLKVKYSVALGDDASTDYVILLVLQVFFMIAVIFYLLARFLIHIRANNKEKVYCKDNLFFLGQITTKLQTSTRSMTLICITMLFAVLLFAMLPLFLGWMSGYLNVRNSYDIQIYSKYNRTRTVEEVENINYNAVGEYLKVNGIEIEWDHLIKMYLPEETLFTRRERINFPVLAMSVSDYNELRKRKDMEPVYLGEDGFLMHWQTVAIETEIIEYMDKHQELQTDGGVLTLSSEIIENISLGESIYNSYTDVFYVLPDQICETLRAVNYLYYVDTKIPLTYDFAERMEKDFEEYYQTGDTGVTYEIRLRTLMENRVYESGFILRASLSYSAIILLVICFTILALQQLYDASNFKARYDILYRLGVEQGRISSLIFRQIFFWFGGPVLIALFFGTGFLIYFFGLLSAEISAYVGMTELVLQVVKILAILLTLLIGYFLLTLYLFKRTVFGGKQI